MFGRCKALSSAIVTGLLWLGCHSSDESDPSNAGVGLTSREVSSEAVSLGTGSTKAAAPIPAIPESNRRMAERLAAIRMGDPPSPFDSERQIARLRTEIAAATSPPVRLQLTRDLAEELLRFGKPEEARELMVSLLDVPGLMTSPQAPKLRRLVREFEALCHLRIGERENCTHRHGAQSCIVPIEGSGVHKDKQGSQAAMAIYDELLAEHPNDMGLRWLRNVAAMTLGEYPAGVPPQLLVPPAAFASDYDLGRFTDVARAAGLQRESHAGGSVVEDLDGDGDLDVFVSGWLLTDPLGVYRNEGDGTFSDQTEASGLSGITGGLNLVHADYDNDGFVDILVLRGAWLGEAGLYPNSLLRNRGNLTFEDVTESAGLLTYHPTQVGAWADYDNDGWLDLFVGNESDGVRHPSELWRNNRNGTFTNRIDLLGEPKIGYVKGAGWGDYDNDGRADLVVVGQSMRPHLFHNEGPGSGEREWRFAEVAVAQGVIGPELAFPTWFWDYDNDGLQDLFIAGYFPSLVAEVAKLYLGLPHETPVLQLYRNTGKGFVNVSREVRIDRVALAMSANFGDLDNDGWLDLYTGTGTPKLECLVPNRMLRNAGGKVFEDVTTSGGFGHIQKGHAISFADLDDDGDQDVFEVMGGAYVTDTSYTTLYENPGHGGRWLKIKLEGRRANRSAIGARLHVRVTTPSGPRDIFSTVSTGGSFGASPLRREIGLGGATRIDSVAITWPGETEPVVFHEVALDRSYRLIEGGALEEAKIHRVTLGGTSSP